MWLEPANMLTIVLLALLWCDVGLAETRVVTTEYGKLSGSDFVSWSGRNYWAFKGIRYAKAPIGNLRFKAPQPPQGWTGVRSATVDPPACIQLSKAVFKNQSEDCLFLNVYTPKIETSQPVIVYFHHGCFARGSARSDFLGPEYLMDRDIVLVVVNSRLGPFGYLSTGDRFSVGNYGLKDQTAALKWVKENINRFGGNPDTVTIAGYDSGSTSVFLHTVSPMSRGLFNKAIAMSGPAYGDWLIRKDHAKLAKKLAELNTCPTSSSEIMVNCLRTIPARKLMNSTSRMKANMMYGLTLFTPVVEPTSVDSKFKFLGLHPVKAFVTGQFNKVPVLTGMTKDEYLGLDSIIAKQDAVLDDISKRNLTGHKDYVLKEIYAANETVKNASLGTGKVLSDLIMILPQIRSARFFVHQSVPVYFYMTTYSGSTSFLQKRKPTDVGHFDDLLYLFHLPKNVPSMWNKTDKEAHAITAFTSMWENFARIGDPTPTNMKTNRWLIWSRGHPKYLNIGTNIVLKFSIPLAQRMVKLEGYIPTPLESGL